MSCVFRACAPIVQEMADGRVAGMWGCQDKADGSRHQDRNDLRLGHRTASKAGTCWSKAGCRPADEQAAMPWRDLDMRHEYLSIGEWRADVAESRAW